MLLSEKNFSFFWESHEALIESVAKAETFDLKLSDPHMHVAVSVLPTIKPYWSLPAARRLNTRVTTTTPNNAVLLYSFLIIPDPRILIRKLVFGDAGNVIKCE
jgi:hypothetical protein